VVAARLSEDPDTSVLLLEAGPDHRSAGTPQGVSGPDMWAALSEPGRIWPELDAAHARGRRAPYLRGRGAGGSSAVNAMIAMRGMPEDYDAWAKESGCTGWDAAAMESLFDALEDDDQKPDSGPVPLQRPDEARWSPLERALRDACLSLGYLQCPDYHQPASEGGFGPTALTTRQGRRVSTNDAYLETARDRANLEIRGGTLEDRVLLDELADDVLDEWLDANVTGYAHAVGTCRMGAVGDPRAVVDPECAVIGYQRLHVVDASVMPDIPRANTHLTTVAIAERVVSGLRRAAR
jgi:5-(hydroxymethyl)furfural/furfural oxidase